MSVPGPSAFEISMQKMNVWLDDILNELGWKERQRAYRALRAVLHALRGHLPFTESAQLAAQLPQAIRGLYYEGWIPSAPSLKDPHWDQFLVHVSESLDAYTEPEAATRAVLKTIAKHVSPGEIADVQRCLPEEFRGEYWQ
jgi:uncharacterized protein (DUF2267 family)